MTPNDRSDRKNVTDESLNHWDYVYSVRHFYAELFGPSFSSQLSAKVI